MSQSRQPTRNRESATRLTLARLSAGRGKLYRLKSGQWTRGGNKFMRTGIGDRLLADKLIELVAVSNRDGREIYDITERGADYFAALLEREAEAE